MRNRSFSRSLRSAGALLAVMALAGWEGLPSWAEAPLVFAIKDARVYPVASPPIERGTVVLRDGLIESVGAGVPVPADAQVIDGKGLVVYPGLIDVSGEIGLPQATPPAAPGPPGPRVATAAAQERDPGLNSFVRAADMLVAGGTRAEAARLAGITTVLVVPPRGIFLGQSALVNLTDDPDTMVVRSPVAMHLRMARDQDSRGYPASLMGVVASVRQAFLDARRYGDSWEIYRRNVRALRRPETSRALEALLPVARKELPLVVSGSSAPEIARALRLAEENGVRLILSGAGEGFQLAPLLKEKQVPVLVSARYPEKPRDMLPEAEESLRALQRRADAPRNAAALHRAGIRFAFFSDGMENPKEFLKNVGRAVKAGLPADAALRALTLSPAEILGAPEQLGSLEPGKIANLVVTDGDLFAEKTRVRHVFVDGRKYTPPPEESRPAEERKSVEGSLSGRWTAVVNIAGANTPLILELTQTGETLAGTMTLRMDAVPIAEGNITGREFRFKAPLRRDEQEEIYAVSGTVEGDLLRGKLTLGDREIEFTGARSPMPRGGGERS